MGNRGIALGPQIGFEMLPWGLIREMLAGATGLEPAASCVTGRRSNQLNYAPA